MNKFILLSCTLISVLTTFSCQTVPLIDLKGDTIINIENRMVIALWPEGTEGINPTIAEKTHSGKNMFYNIHNPSLTLFKPKTPNGTSVIIIPGGGYGAVGFNLEGVPTAERLVKEGITVFILKYRLPTTKGVNFKHPVPLMDAQRAIKLVRYHADTFDIRSDQIGIIGFSAGGHLASTAGTLFNSPIQASDDIGKINCRPDFMMLIYPVITTQAKESCHPCTNSLVGKDSAPGLLKKLSNELNVTHDTPPTFLAHAKDDKGVPPKNSRLFHEALKKHGIRTTLKIYEKGGHYKGFFKKESDNDALNWMDDCVTWMHTMELLSENR
ncbi:alpha/beta hydrolase [Lentisphaera profundi]|uniref:Alpha/beta hydrolase n=1 Tax=Lentisphaera profundi TaxID=1658616 RepID=A0ABY7VU14_9BACT|nr:alpha/beta hydrolase [Lentisphaera profundi]WDE97547.1 alpha/beta hydrolase [Lentisphaera profundi]